MRKNIKKSALLRRWFLSLKKFLSVFEARSPGEEKGSTVLGGTSGTRLKAGGAPNAGLYFFYSG